MKTKKPKNNIICIRFTDDQIELIRQKYSEINEQQDAEPLASLLRRQIMFWARTENK